MLRIIPLLFFYLFISQHFSAQQNSFTQFSVSDGLGQSQVNKIYQDSLGFLWTATAGGGVSRFDGENFTSYNENNGLGGNIVTAIAEGESNKIYFGSTWGPVAFFRNDKINRLSDNETGIENLIYDKKSKTLYGSKNNTLLYYRSNHWESISTYSKERINGFFLDAENQIYFFTNSQISSLNTETNEITKFYKTKQKVTAVLWHNKKLIIALLNSGLYKLSKQKELTPLVQKGLPKEAYINHITSDLNNNIWFSTYSNGIFSFNEKRSEKTAYRIGLPSVKINDLYCDKQNNIWVGSNGDGIYKYLETPFINYANIEGLNKGNNFAILKDHKGNIWTGTNSDGCYVYNGETVINYNTQNNLPNNSVFSIVESSDNRIWIATREGLVYFEDEKFNTLTTKDGLIDNAINCLYYDKQDRLWIGTSNGLSILENSQFTNYGTDNGLINNTIHSIYEDRRGIIWIGTSDGLMKYYDGNFRKYGEVDGLCNSYVGSITEDNNGVLWVGTDRCISKLVDERFIPYTEKDGLNSTIIYLMNKDNQGNLWVGTNKGLDKITLNEKSEITDIEFYGKNEGFYGIENNTRGTYKDKEGNLYFATIKGVFKYQSQYANKKNYCFPLYINNIKLFLNPIDSIYLFGDRNPFGITDSIILPAEKNHVTFEFIGLDLKSSEKVSYSYKLENFDSTWFENTTSKYAVYSNLPPGEYSFLVKAQSKENTSIPSEIHCYLKIEESLPPFYLRWWFLLLCIVLTISIIYNILALKNKALKISKEELEEKIKKRTEEITKQNKEKTLLLQEIHHRVKNNLQIINSLFNIQAHYTDSEETKVIFRESQNRILSMSKIHQSLYESNDFSKLNLKSYITTLVTDIKTSYELSEAVNLDLNIEEDITIDLDSLIPFALIINEIISNSLKYAFKDQTENKISIEIKQDFNKRTKIKISDNGVGLPSNFNWENPISMGVDLIKTLTDQLNGTIEVESKNGTHYLLIFVSK